MDELIKMVSEKAGISMDQARKALETVSGFLKDKLPADTFNQLSKAVGGLGDMASDAAKSAGKAASSAAGTASDAAKSAGKTATDAAKGATSTAGGIVESAKDAVSGLMGKKS